MPTSTVDSKRRVVLPAVKPGDVFDIQPQGEGRFLLVRLQPVECPEPKSSEQCLEAMARSPLRLTMSWDELSQLTREP